MSEQLRSLPRLAECLQSMESQESIVCRFPNKKCTAGAALKHVTQQVSSLLRKEYPCVFKIGYTHDLTWRWGNNIYGYKNDRDKYETMVGLYISEHAIGAALMEAFLINHHQGFSAI